jgi:hypothetical protein
MNKYAIKLRITNNKNDEEKCIWAFFPTEEARDIWVNHKHAEENEWNYKTVGARSMRYYDFYPYTLESILQLPMSEFGHMTLANFLELIKNLTTDSL